MKVTRAYFACALLTLFYPLKTSAAEFTSLDIRFNHNPTGFWGRYIVTERPIVRAGLIRADNGEDHYTINGLRPSDTLRVKALLYAPGCGVQALDMAIRDLRPYQYEFTCERLPEVEIDGVLPHAAPRSPVARTSIEAKYVAGWAKSFFVYDDGTTTEIPLGTTATFIGENQFRLPVPDLRKDPLTGSPDHAGEVRLWLRDMDTGRIVDQLRVSHQNAAFAPTRFGGIPIQALQAVQTLLFCYAGTTVLQHDEFGFAIRADSGSCGTL